MHSPTAHFPTAHSPTAHSSNSHSPTAHSSNSHSLNSNHSSNTHSGSDSACVWHQEHRCFAPNHAITSQDECYTQEHLKNSHICDAAGSHFNTVTAVTQTLAPYIEVLAPHIEGLASHLGM